jgi:deazaflavin-dependent oxidoreductase (nitroreductase family)
MRRTMMRLINPMMTWLLHSAVHRIVSDHYLLMTITGRRSRQPYVTPVQYAQDGQTLTVVTSAEYTWWKNLRGGADVRVLLRGKRVTGRAQTFEDPQTIASAFQRLYPHRSSEPVIPGSKKLVAIKITLTGQAA